MREVCGNCKYNCETCRWYIYPLMTSGKLTTHLLPIVIADKRYCSRGWCEYEKREEADQKRKSKSPKEPQQSKRTQGKGK